MYALTLQLVKTQKYNFTWSVSYTHAHVHLDNPILHRHPHKPVTQYQLTVIWHNYKPLQNYILRKTSICGYDLFDLTFVSSIYNTFSQNLLTALLNSLFCLSLLLFPYPLPLPQVLLFHKHIALMGPEGLWGYAISSRINNPTAIRNMHAFFPRCFSPMYIFTP